MDGSYIIYSQRDRVPFCARSNRRGSLNTTAAVEKCDEKLWETAENGASSSLLRGWRAAVATLRSPAESHLCGLGCGRPRRLTRRCLGHRVPPAHRRVPPHCARARLVPRSRRACQRRTAMPINATGLSRRFIPRECFTASSLSLFIYPSIHLSVYLSICISFSLYLSISLSFSFSCFENKFLSRFHDEGGEADRLGENREIIYEKNEVARDGGTLGRGGRAHFHRTFCEIYPREIRRVLRQRLATLDF